MERREDTEQFVEKTLEQPEAWPEVHPGVVREARAAAGLVSRGWRVRLSRPCCGVSA